MEEFNNTLTSEKLFEMSLSEVYWEDAKYKFPNWEHNNMDAILAVNYILNHMKFNYKNVDWNHIEFKIKIKILNHLYN